MVWFLAAILVVGCREGEVPVAPLKSKVLSETKRPDPARFAKEIAAFDKEELENAPPRGGIVFTGSSSIRLWKLGEAFADLPVLNRGFGGSVANDLIVYADQVVLRYEPKVLVVYTGSNDINAKLTVEEALADFTGFLELVNRKLPETKVLVNPVKISRKRIEQIEKVRELNGKLKAWCAERPWTRWVETAQYLEDENGQPIDRFFAKDQLHLSPEGYVEWEKILGPVLREEWEKKAKG
ncbi:GDSL-type esterase/lipase family protein [Phragmitibacter flavus]|uniref:GDSL-type esterase/lipase family protein n=1 Tax=Phragmitibacter flavus TaxID=2576071 RepID=UPI00140D0AAB|nr:GDSL-type esterase/lipase family protein [Phragmitibacter flavus]